MLFLHFIVKIRISAANHNVTEIALIVIRGDKDEGRNEYVSCNEPLIILIIKRVH
jgi:hypothetical protein